MITDFENIRTYDTPLTCELDLVLKEACTQHTNVLKYKILGKKRRLNFQNTVVFEIECDRDQ